MKSACHEDMKHLFETFFYIEGIFNEIKNCVVSALILALPIVFS